jgi:hypothetical protein
MTMRRKSRPVRGGSDLCLAAWDRSKPYSLEANLATIPPMIARHIGAAFLASLAAGGEA